MKALSFPPSPSLSPSFLLSLSLSLPHSLHLPLSLSLPRFIFLKETRSCSFPGVIWQGTAWAPKLYWSRVSLRYSGLWCGRKESCPFGCDVERGGVAWTDEGRRKWWYLMPSVWCSFFFVGIKRDKEIYCVRNALYFDDDTFFGTVWRRISFFIISLWFSFF